MVDLVAIFESAVELGDGRLPRAPHLGVVSTWTFEFLIPEHGERRSGFVEFTRSDSVEAREGQWRDG
jgi:hypothetical protein